MKPIFKALLLAAAPLTAIAALPGLATAQVAVAPSVGVANLEEAMQKSNAFVLAINQIKITYKPQIDQFEARSKALNAEIQPLVTAFQTAQRAPNPNQAALQTQLTALQARQQAAQKELQSIYMPVGRAQAYVEEQIAGKMDGALKAAMTKKKIAVVLQPQATISYQPSVDITNDIVTEINTLVPSVTTTPPANWQPGGQGGQAAAGQPQPQGR